MGVDFAFDSSVKGLVREGESGPITVQYESDGKPATLEVDTVIWAVGRLPNIKKLNLESAKCRFDREGLYCC